MLDYGKKCVVIDLDETLVHSSFKVNQHKKQSITFVILVTVCWKRKSRKDDITVHEEIPVIVAYYLR